MKDILDKDFDKDKTYYYVETEKFNYLSNNLTDALLLWKHHHFDLEDDRTKVIAVGRMG